ncbi:hypothetical protein [Hymenobacter elongatus]|uniref:GTPase n=1 Tax=Hymenobacter elongatus TaxID=877208 RepID=A0A4Z0PH87_9BACT|nr:hypothetical protein [Hymenobacter elongatus]TGE14535.1 hypothetical protein E5J99_15860 [Hymenobacter elongatus]
MQELIFVYNADTGLVNGLLDLAHKVVSPATYKCSLCALTYGARMRPEWKAFLNSLPVRARFFHRDDFSATYPQLAATNLPAVFRQATGKKPALFVSAAELNQTDLPGLMHLLQQRLSAVTAP